MLDQKKEFVKKVRGSARKFVKWQDGGGGGGMTASGSIRVFQ